MIGLRAVDGFLAVRTGGFLTLIELPIREVLLRLIRLAELAADGFAAVGTDGFLTLMELPTREVLLRLIRLAELAVDDFAAVETDGFLTLMGLAIREVLLWLIRLLELLVNGFGAVETDGFLVLIGLAIREVLLWLIRLDELDVDGFGAAGTDGFLTLMELPTREVLLRFIRLAELAVDGFAAVETDGFLALMGLAIREVLLRLMLLRVLVVGGFPTLELGAADFLLPKELPEGLRTLEAFPGRETIVRLGVVLVGGLLRVTLLGWLTLGLEVILELLLVKGLEVLTLELLLVEGLEALTLELLLVEGLELLTLVRGADVVRVVPALEDRGALGAAELFATVRLFWLPPLDLLPLVWAFFAVTGPASNIKAKVTVSRINLTFFECFRVNMAILLIKLIFFLFIYKSTFDCQRHIKSKKHIKNAITGAFYCTATLLFHPLKASTISPVTRILCQNRPGTYFPPKHNTRPFFIER